MYVYVHTYAASSFFRFRFNIQYCRTLLYFLKPRIYSPNCLQLAVCTVSKFYFYAIFRERKMVAFHLGIRIIFIVFLLFHGK